MRTGFSLVLTVITMLLVSTRSFSQAECFSIWTDYNHSNLLKGKWSLVSDYSYRTRIDFDYNWQRLHARTGFVYHTKSVKLLTGAALFFCLFTG